MLKQTSDSPDRSVVLYLGDDNNKSPVNLGTIADVAHAHSDDAEFLLEVEWTTPEAMNIEDPDTPDKFLCQSKKLSFSSHVTAKGGKKLTIRGMQYGIGDTTFGLIQKSDKTSYELQTNHKSFKFKRNVGKPWPIPPPVKFYGFADEVRAYHQNAGFLSELELAFEKMLRGVYYLGPLRAPPGRRYPWGGEVPSDMGPFGNNAISAIIASRDRGDSISRGRGYKSKTLEETVASWLQRLGLIDSFEVKPIEGDKNLFRVLVKKSPSSPSVLITDVGFGVSQVLPVLVLCYYAPKGSTILLEQPEIHLHPSAQRGLADVFIDAMKVRDVQIIVESHSEDFLRRLQRRVAEAKVIKESDAAIYFCDIEDGKAKLTSLELDAYGNFLAWPKDFFGDPMGDIVAMQLAAMKRKGISEE